MVIGKKQLAAGNFQEINLPSGGMGGKTLGEEVMK